MKKEMLHTRRKWGTPEDGECAPYCEACKIDRIVYKKEQALCAWCSKYDFLAPSEDDELICDKCRLEEAKNDPANCPSCGEPNNNAEAGKCFECRLGDMP